MREIKFRAWEKNLNEIIPVDAVDFERKIINQNGPWRFFDEIELMQYTGLKDKNGREIYEGDLFQWEEGAVGVIKYKDGSFYLETNIALPGDSVHAPGFYSPWLRVIKHELETELEIIGNIYENPELLEENEQ